MNKQCQRKTVFEEEKNTFYDAQKQNYSKTNYFSRQTVFKNIKNHSLSLNLMQKSYLTDKTKTFRRHTLVSDQFLRLKSQ